MTIQKGKHHERKNIMKAVIAAYARSPFHFARKGRLAEVRPDTMAAQVVQGLLQRILPSESKAEL